MNDDGFVKTQFGLLVKKESVGFDTTIANPNPVWSITRRTARDRGTDDFDLTAQDRWTKVENARHRDPIIFRGVDYYVKLTMGTGATLSPVDDSPEAETVHAALDRFWEENDVYDSEQFTMMVELTAHANVFGWLPKIKRRRRNDYVPALILLPAGQIERIVLDDETGRPAYYRRVWNKTTYPQANTEARRAVEAMVGRVETWTQDIVADEMVHTAINRGAQELRGSSMIEPAIVWTTLYHRTLQTVWAYAVARAMFGVHLHGEGWSSEQVEKIRDDFEDNVLVDIEDPTGLVYKGIAAGQFLVTGGQGVTMEAISAELRGGTVDQELRRVLLMGATAMGLPEFTLSDGNNSNLASSESQNAPFVRLMLAHQSMGRRTLRKFNIAAVRRYQEAGVLKTVKLPEKKSTLADYVNINLPNVLEPEVRSLGYVALALVNGGVWSKQYANQLLGSDWDKMKDEMTAEREDGFSPISLLLGPDGLPIGASGGAAGGGNPDLQALGLEAREETSSVTGAGENKMRDLILAYAKRLKAAGNNRDAAVRAYVEFVSDARKALEKVIDKAEAVGVRSAA